MYEYKMDANMYQGLIETIAHRIDQAVWTAFEDEYPYPMDDSLRELPGVIDFKKSIAELVEYVIDQTSDDYEVTLVKKTTFTFNMKALNEDDIYEYIGDMRDPEDLDLEYNMYVEEDEWEVERVRQV